jgi:hypothetical protein
MRYLKVNMLFMKNQPSTIHPLIQVIKRFLGKIRQNPDVYPIRYYKKGKQFRRKWQSPIVK